MSCVNVRGDGIGNGLGAHKPVALCVRALIGGLGFSVTFNRVDDRTPLTHLHLPRSVPVRSNLLKYHPPKPDAQPAASLHPINAP